MNHSNFCWKLEDRYQDPEDESVFELIYVSIQNNDIRIEIDEDASIIEYLRDTVIPYFKNYYTKFWTI